MDLYLEPWAIYIALSERDYNAMESPYSRWVFFPSSEGEDSGLWLVSSSWDSSGHRLTRRRPTQWEIEVFRVNVYPYEFYRLYPEDLKKAVRKYKEAEVVNPGAPGAAPPQVVWC